MLDTAIQTTAVLLMLQEIVIFNKQDYDVWSYLFKIDSFSLCVYVYHYSLEETQEKDEKRKLISSYDIISSTILLRSFNC